VTPQRRAQSEIRQIRREMRINRYEFAKLMNVCMETVIAWETGKRNPIKGELLSIWWRDPIKAALIANRVIQVAFSE